MTGLSPEEQRREHKELTEEAFRAILPGVLKEIRETIQGELKQLQHPVRRCLSKVREASPVHTADDVGKRPSVRARCHFNNQKPVGHTGTGLSEEGSGGWDDWTHRHFRSYNLASIAATEAERNEVLEEVRVRFPRSPESELLPEDAGTGTASSSGPYRELPTVSPRICNRETRENPGEKPPMPHMPSRQRLSTVWAKEYHQVVNTRCRRIWKSIEEIVKSNWFEHAVGVIVLVNAVCIGCETDEQSRYIGARIDFKPSPWIRSASIVFSVLFSMELTLRVAMNPCQFFDCHGDQIGWNLFDTCVVIFQFFELVDGDSQMISGAGLLRVARVFRILRLVRVVRFFPELRTLISSMLASLESLLWALLMLVGIIYTFSVTFCQIVADAGAGIAHHDDLKQWFGSLSWSALTMLECITGGVSWAEVIRPIIIDVGAWAGILFCIYIVTCIFAVTNTVTGVFVEKITTTAVQDRATQLAYQLRDLFFKASETDEDREITLEVFIENSQRKEMKAFFQSIDVDPGECAQFFHLLDIDGSGTLEPEELVNGCLRLSGPAQALDVALLMRQNSVVLNALNRIQDKLLEVSPLSRVHSSAQVSEF